MAFIVFVDGTGNELTAAQMNTVMKQTVIVCTSATRPSSPPTGMPIFETDTTAFKIWDGALWRRYGVNLELASPVQATSPTDQGNITSTAWDEGSNNCIALFTGPVSGRALVTVSGYVGQSTDGYETYLSWEFRTGSTAGAGTEVWAPSTDRMHSVGKAVNTGAAAQGNGSYGPFMLTGLTPGSPYHVRTMHKVTGGTGNVWARHIIVVPVH